MKHKTRIVFFIFILALFSGLLFSCAFMAQVAKEAGLIDEKSAQAIARAAEDITPEQEYYIGRAVAANILNNYNIYNGSPDLTAYLNQICKAIVINSPRPVIFNDYHVNILDSQEINAFATSGGHIFITLGLIACADSEEALAGVIAHEISHIQLKHGLKVIKNSRWGQAIVVTGASKIDDATGMNLGELTEVFSESVGEIINTLVNSGFSPNQEYEADKEALSLMAKTGYDPSGLISMLKVLERTQTDTASGFGKTHPKPADRISRAEKLIGQYKVQNTRSYRTERYRATGTL